MNNPDFGFFILFAYLGFTAIVLVVALVYSFFKIIEHLLGDK